MMAGHAAIAVKSPKTMIDGCVSPKVTVVTHESKQTQHDSITEVDTRDYGDHVVLIGKHGYELSLGLELEMDWLALR